MSEAAQSASGQCWRAIIYDDGHQEDDYVINLLPRLVGEFESADSAWNAAKVEANNSNAISFTIEPVFFCNAQPAIHA